MLYAIYIDICYANTILEIIFIFSVNTGWVLRNVVRLLWCSIVPLQVLQEAEEQGVHGHGVDREEGEIFKSRIMFL